MRLINSYEFKQKLLADRDLLVPKTVNTPFAQAVRYGFHRALRCMEKTPTVKIETVKHGKWTVEEVPLWIVKGKVVSTSIVCVCSACGRNADTKTKYCPNCGAKMDGGAENE